MPRPRRIALSLATVLAPLGLAWGGHEVAVYPSYYPHEIHIERLQPADAARQLGEAKLQAYLAPKLSFPAALPTGMRAIDSFGGWLVARAGPKFAGADKGSGCALLDSLLRDLAERADYVFHPYPVTPWHGDYLYHLDRAEAEKVRLMAKPRSQRQWRIKAPDALAGTVPPEWRSPGNEWDAAIEPIDIAGILESARTSLNGWPGPPWLKAGWFQAAQILDITGSTAALTQRLEHGDYRDNAERMNLERELVAELNGSCAKRVAGYFVKHQYVTVDFTNGIENIGFDSQDGLNAAIFIRTVKLKDFPWNGWLRLAVDRGGDTAWNPVAGFADPLGRLIWSAVGDPAAFAAPYDAGSMLNRIADVRAEPTR